MAKNEKDDLADALAALAGGEHQETEEHADDIHGHAAAEAPVEPPAPAPAPPAAPPVAPPRQAPPVRPAVQAPRPAVAKAPVAPPVRPAAPRPAAPSVARPPAPPAPQAMRPPAPSAAPARVRPATPVLPTQPVAPPAPLDSSPASPRRPETPDLGIAPQPPSEAASPSEFVPSEVPSAESAENVVYEQSADGNGQDEFAAPVDEYAEQPDPEQTADDQVYAPAPEVTDFMRRRYDPLLRGLGFKRTLIPIFIVLGALFLLAPLFGWAVTAEESGFRMLPTWYPIMLIVFGIVLLVSAGVLMMQVSFLLKRQAELGVQAE